MTDARRDSAGAVLVTGASGFVGSALVRALLRDGVPVTAAVRAEGAVPPAARRVAVGDIGATTDWTEALAGVHACVHLAGRAHVLHEEAADPLAAYRSVNVDGSLVLARQALAAGVTRFVYVSSIKVNGESTPSDRPFREEDPPAPEDAYGRSKLEAEEALRALVQGTRMSLVVIRPPLIYGPGVRANFRSLVRWLSRGVPLPLGALRTNRRSLLALDNLVDLIRTVLRHPAAANELFLASDGEDLSTVDLLERTARALGVRARLVPVPAALLQALAVLARRRPVYDRLAGSLRVDSSRATRLLGWRPPVAVDEGLARTVAEFRRGGA